MDVFFESARVPVFCNVLWPTRQGALRCPRGDIQLGFCHTCGFIGNLAFDPDRLDYGQNYENSLHFSARFQEYAEALANHLIDRYGLHDKDIIEIGCGKGEFLTLLCKLGGNRGIGFDYSYESGRVDTAAEAGVTFIRDFYTERYASYPCDLVCSRHVLEHIHQPAAFLAGLRRTVGDRANTAVFFEVPNALFTFAHMAIWDILYEHCSYFCPESLARLFASCGFRVRELKETYEGQFLCLEAFPGNGAAPESTRNPKSLKRTATDVAVFGGKYKDKVEHWRGVLERMRRAGQRAVLWGAGSKGVTFLNTLKVEDQVEYVVDINPHKQGMHIPGTGQKVIPPEFLRDYRPDTVILMNPIYRDEVARQLASLELVSQLVSP